MIVDAVGVQVGNIALYDVRGTMISDIKGHLDHGVFALRDARMSTRYATGVRRARRSVLRGS